jgi:hypothetical protein
MEAICIKETKWTPEVNFNPKTGKLDIVGYRSMPEISTTFYQPVIDWVKEYINNPASNLTEISIKLEYYNTSSGKCFVEILKKLDNLASKGHHVVLKWYYEEDDEDMAVNGDDIQALLKHVQVYKISYTSNA